MPLPPRSSAAAAAAISPYLSVIVPAYNEAGSITRTLEAVCRYLDRRPWGYEVIVSADGDDGTRERAAGLAAANPRITVIGGPGRGGKGRGVRDGVRRARGRFIGFVDADYKTPIEELDKFLPALDAGCDVVIGSRALGESQILRHQPLYRRLGSTAFRWVMRAMVGLYGVSDTQCGFKFFRGPVARDLFARQRIDGYMFDVEVLRLARTLGYRIEEVGVRWQDDGDSRYDPIGGTLKNAGELLRIRFMRYADPLGTADQPQALPGSAAGPVPDAPLARIARPWDGGKSEAA